jgi:adenylate cyclase
VAGAEEAALPLGPMDAPLGALVVATERPGGFAGPELLALGDMAPRVGAACELRALRRTELPVLDAHCGRPTARRVLGRQLRAGRVETLEAAWLRCRPGGDRGPGGVDPAVQLERLGGFVANVAQVAADRGGLVVSTSEDGALAVFCQDDARAACAAAAEAAQELVRSEAGLTSPQIALHYGPVSYGGLPGRGSALVVLGPAQPLLNGLLASCTALNHPILLTAAFAARLPTGCARPLLSSDDTRRDREVHVLAEDHRGVAAAPQPQTDRR